MTENRIVKDALLAEFAGEDSILMDVDGKRYHRLNETAAFIWKALEENRADADIAAALEQEFEVTPELAETSVKAFVAQLSSRGLVRADSPNR